MQNYNFIACLEVAEKFMVVGWGGVGWGGGVAVQAMFRVQL